METLFDEKTETVAPKVYNGFYTIENTVAKTHRTFKIATVKGKASDLLGQRIIYLLIGSDNRNQYKGFGFVSDRGISLWSKYRDNSQYALLVKCFWSMATEGENSPYYLKGARITEARHCIRCNRLLTDPQSISIGVGPECRKMKK